MNITATKATSFIKVSFPHDPRSYLS